MAEGRLAQKVRLVLSLIEAAAWDELAGLVAAKEFLFVGPAKEEMDWRHWLEHMSLQPRTGGASSIRRVEEVDQLVFWERDEPALAEGESKTLETMTIFEFDAQDRLCRIDIFH